MQDAEDITQEIIIKIVLKLKLFDRNKGGFKTWLNKVSINHILSKKSNSKTKNICFKAYSEDIEAMYVNKDLYLSEEDNYLIKEAQEKCLNSLLICLEKKQRAAFILIKVVGLRNREAAQIMKMSEVNFRKLLSRSKQNLFGFMEENCNLFNKTNKCNCRFFARKTVIPEDVSKVLLKRRETINQLHNDVSQILKDSFYNNQNNSIEYIQALVESEKYINLFV